MASYEVDETAKPLNQVWVFMHEAEKILEHPPKYIYVHNIYIFHRESILVALLRPIGSFEPI